MLLRVGGEEERKNNGAFLLRRQSAIRCEGSGWPMGGWGQGAPMLLGYTAMILP